MKVVECECYVYLGVWRTRSGNISSLSLCRSRATYARLYKSV